MREVNDRNSMTNNPMNNQGPVLDNNQPRDNSKSIYVGDVENLITGKYIWHRVSDNLFGAILAICFVSTANVHVAFEIGA